MTMILWQEWELQDVINVIVIYKMNLVDCYVTKILDEPYFLKLPNDKEIWVLNVEYDCYGSMQEIGLIFETKEEADKVEIGYKFLG